MALEIPTFGENGSKESIAVSDAVFGQEFNGPLVHQLLTCYLAGGRTGSRAQKTRSQVRGGGSKPWRQKGTGRARSGTRNSPIWRGGGVTFAAQQTSFAQKINKKMYRAGMRSILSELLRQDRLLLCNSIAIGEPKTKVLNRKLKELNLDRTLIVTEADDKNLSLASRNLAKVEATTADDLNPVSLVGADSVVLTNDALKKLEERFL